MPRWLRILFAVSSINEHAHAHYYVFDNPTSVNAYAQWDSKGVGLILDPEYVELQLYLSNTRTPDYRSTWPIHSD